VGGDLRVCRHHGHGGCGACEEESEQELEREIHWRQRGMQRMLRGGDGVRSLIL